MSGKSIFIINGPNLNRLGSREPETYGSDTLSDIQALCEKSCDMHGYKLVFLQSNHEGQLVEWLQEAADKADGVILNAAAYTHTSVAIHDACKLLSIPLIEVHLSNIFAREKFRHYSYISSVAKGVICGLGLKGYQAAIETIFDTTK